jgi:hypothetical protein
LLARQVRLSSGKVARVAYLREQVMLSLASSVAVLVLLLALLLLQPLPLVVRLLGLLDLPLSTLGWLVLLAVP